MQCSCVSEISQHLSSKSWTKFSLLLTATIYSSVRTIFPFFFIIFHCEMQGSLQLYVILHVQELWQRYFLTSHPRPTAWAPYSCARDWRKMCTVELQQQLFFQRWEARGGGGRGEERKGMHSWWISHFGLWPGSHPGTFKLAAACKTFHISHRVLHPL